MTIYNQTELSPGSSPVVALNKYASKATTLLLYGSLALVFLWYGGMKFTAYEAEGIRPIVASSPLVSPLLSLFGTQGASNFIGVIEVAIGLLLVGRLLSPKLALLGGLGGIATFLMTLSFMFTTPGVIATHVGPLALSIEIGLFLLKDVVLLAASVFIVKEATDSIINDHTTGA